MKKHRSKIFLFLSLFLLFFLSACSGRSGGGERVNVYNWGEYIDPDLIKKFEAETGIDVIYSNFATNEDMYIKLKQAGSNYDLVVPSEYMLQRMMKEDMVQDIDFNNIPNMKYIDEDFQYRDYDPEQRYSIPYFWGTMGILYNKNMLEDVPDSWDILWDEKYKGNIIMLDSSRDSLAVSLIRQGHSINTGDMGELEEATKDLEDQYPLVYAYLVDQTRDIMINNECALALVYSGDAQACIWENEDLKYVIPKEGSNIWYDLFAIPKGAPNKENAERFINFMLEPENMAQNAEWVGYAVPSEAARKLLPEDMADSRVSYPDLEENNNLEIFKYLGDFISVYDQAWQRVKNQ